MTRPLPDEAGATRLALELAETRCLVATPCTLRVRAAAPGRLGPANPSVETQTGGLEVLSLSPEYLAGAARTGVGTATDFRGPDAWLVRVIAFEPGEMMSPVMEFQVSTGGAAPQLVRAPTMPVLIRPRQLAPGTVLADIESPLETGLTLIDATASAAWFILLLAVALGLTWITRRLRPAAALRARFGRAAGGLSRRPAARALRRLRRSAVPDAPSQVYSTMVTILRRTLMPRLGAVAMSATSSELIALIEHQSSATLAQQRLAPLLAASDRVKFAGYRPTAQELVADCTRALELVRDFERAGLMRASVPSRA